MTDLFLVKRNDKIDYDQYDEMVVVAEDEAAARLMHPAASEPIYTWNGTNWVRKIGGHYYVDEGSWAPPDTLIVIRIGTAVAGLSGVICASFYAG